MDSSAVVGFGGLLLALATMLINASRDKARLKHQRAMQEDRFREERALRLLDTAFEKLDGIRQATPVRVVFLYPLNELPMGLVDLTDTTLAEVRLSVAARELVEAGNDIDKARVAAEWFFDRGWTPEIREKGKSLVAALGDHDITVWERRMLYSQGQTESANEAQWLDKANEQSSNIHTLTNELADLLRQS